MLSTPKAYDTRRWEAPKESNSSPLLTCRPSMGVLSTAKINIHPGPDDYIEGKETPRHRNASISPSRDRNQPTGKTSSPRWPRERTTPMSLTLQQPPTPFLHGPAKNQTRPSPRTLHQGPSTPYLSPFFIATDMDTDSNTPRPMLFPQKTPSSCRPRVRDSDEREAKHRLPPTSFAPLYIHAP